MMSTTAPSLECLELEVDPDFKKTAYLEISDLSGGYGFDSREDDVSADEKFRYIGGRRYHGFEGEGYALPNDNKETRRLEIQNFAWKLALGGGLHLSPIKDNVEHVLDIGTGPGRWAIDFATAHSGCQVIGTDISPTQMGNAPSNCTFLMQNMNEDWKFSERSDLIHSRMIMMGVKSWENYFKQAWKQLRPGGWIDLQETMFPANFVDNGAVKSDSPLYKFTKYVMEAGVKLGIDFSVINRYSDILKAQGFTDIQHETVQWPVGAWAKGKREKEIGSITWENVRDYFVQGVGMILLTSALGWSEQQVLDLTEQVRKELDQGVARYYFTMHLVSAQKPQDALS